MSDNRQKLIEELRDLIKFYDDEYYSYYLDTDPKYQSYCGRAAHIGTMLEYLLNVLTGKQTDYSLVDKYLKGLIDHNINEPYDESFIERLKKELEWIQ